MNLRVLMVMKREEKEQWWGNRSSSLLFARPTEPYTAATRVAGPIVRQCELSFSHGWTHLCVTCEWQRGGDSDETRRIESNRR